MQGWFPGVQWHLESIRRYSPSARIHVLGNAETRQHLDCIPIEDYWEGAGKFTRVYEHMSVNPLRFEVMCFQRWFIMYDYAKRNGIEAFWHFDWDLLIFTDLEREYVPIGMTTPLHTFYCRKMDWFRVWLEMIQEAYEEKGYFFLRWRKFWHDSDWPCVSDMMVARDTLKHLEVFGRITRDGFWDHNLALATYGFVYDNWTNDYSKNCKVLKWVSGQPYALHELGNWVRLKSMHCWGIHKGRMQEYLEKGLANRK